MTWGWIAFVAVSAGTAAVLSFVSGYLYGEKAGRIRGYAAGVTAGGRLLARYLDRDEPTDVVVRRAS
jgi:hypothetical protein